MTNWLKGALGDAVILLARLFSLLLIPSVLLASIMFTLVINIAPAAAAFLMRPRGIVILLAVTLIAQWGLS